MPPSPFSLSLSPHSHSSPSLFSPRLTASSSSSFIESTLTNMARLLVSLQLVLSYPLMLLPGRDSLISFWATMSDMLWPTSSYRYLFLQDRLPGSASVQMQVLTQSLQILKSQIQVLIWKKRIVNYLVSNSFILQKKYLKFFKLGAGYDYLGGQYIINLWVQRAFSVKPEKLNKLFPSPWWHTNKSPPKKLS